MLSRLRLSLPPLLCAVIASAMAVVALPAHAEEHCAAADAWGTRECRSGLAADSVRQMAVVQQQPQWCWAASIAMIFAHHGYRVQQDEIVKDGYGIAADRPAPSGQAMTNALSKGWIDQDDRAFQTHALASDAFAGRFQVSNDQVLAELAANRPLLIGVLGHAVVLVEMQYQRLASGAVRMIGGTVVDPQPGRGIRPLLTAEMRPTYVAAVRVTPAEQRVGAADVLRGEAPVLR